MTMDAAIGFRAKTGRAIAVVISADAGAPRFVWRGEVTLADPSAEVGPYHEVMELPWNEATIAVRPLVAAIESFAETAVRTLIAELKDVTIRAIGVVGSAPRNIDRIGNPHIRAHAAEGILFRRVLELAAERIAIPHLAFTDKELDTDVVRPLGRIVGPPWRADERLAAAAAWAALNSPA